MVGYEALTRFDSGQGPDLCFADAWSIGLGPDLEIATLDAALAAAKGLAAEHWLDLNVSPRLLAEPARLGSILRAADRPLVLEITEHEKIDDYGAVRAAVATLGDDIRLAVDDAGAGVANFTHIIELQPDFVKLDIGLVRGVDADPGRQAMVVAMRHFARTSGCRLVAEGVETRAEADALAAFGVEFGQGYLLGRPEPAEVWAARGSVATPVNPGETILFVRPNVGRSLTHEFQVGPAGRVALDQADGQIVVEVDKIEPLHVDYLTYTFGSVGPYPFACHEPGHCEAGMKGVIDLTP